MTETIWQTIAATPWWVYAFFAYLIWVSFLTTKPRLASIKSLSNMSIFFTSLSIMGMCSMLSFITLVHFSIWVGSLFLGTGLGYLQFCILKIKPVKNTNAISLPGTYAPLIILLLFFTIKFYWGYSLVIDPHIFINPKYSILLVFLYGLLTGLSIGKLSYALRYLQIMRATQTSPNNDII